MRVYACQEVTPPRGVAGQLRPAARWGVELLVPWGRKFSVETEEVGNDDPVTPRIADGRLNVWQVDGKWSLCRP